MTPSFEASLRAFAARDYATDIALLNRELAKPGCATAGFELAPPSILTGDPLDTTNSRSLMVLGINPKWQNPNLHFQDEISKLVEKLKDFDDYRAWRSLYFRGSEYYGRYFTRIGCAIAGSFFADEFDERNNAKKSKKLFERFAVKFDLLPWWSKNLDCMNIAKAASFEPVLAWRFVLQSFVAEMRPKAIVVNASGQRGLVEILLSTDLEPISGVDAWGGLTEKSNTPVFMHRQLNARGGLSYDRYKQAVQSWRAQFGIR